MFGKWDPERAPRQTALQPGQPTLSWTKEKNELEEQIADIIAPVLADLGFDLVQVRLRGTHPKTLQIMAERPDGTISIDDCADISRALSAVLDVEDPISGEYHLEVSSPGIARPLVRPRDFERFAGHLAKIELKDPIEGRRRFKGILDGMEEDRVLIAVEGDVDEDGNEMVYGLPLSQIAEARLVMTDELLALAGANDNNGV
ncbi:MAG: ribosome maturation factor RimP [Alphaproteobacteria bacterium]|nr:MAG: ribosome maturation factor RimP [Alphaproteobacteria bacterium]